MEDAIGAIDWPKVIEAAAASPLGMIALVIILVSVIGYFMLRGASQHYRFIAFVMLFGGGVSLATSVMKEKDFNRRPVTEAQAKDTKDVKVQVAQTLKNTTAFRNVKNNMNLAEVTKKISAIKAVNSTNTRMRIKRIKQINPKCAGTKFKTWDIDARPGWKIVPDSVDIKVGFRSPGSGVTGVEYLSQSRFRVKAKIVNRGTCKTRFGINFKDRRGGLYIYLRYRETKVL